MKFSALQENLKQALFAVSHVAGKNLSLPILNNIMIEANDGNIKLTATNLEIGVTSLVRGKVEKEGSFTVDAKILLDYITLLPNKKIDIEVVQEKLIISCENYNTKINGQAADEYPLIPVVERNNLFKVKIEDFKKGLSQVVFAVAGGESRIELTGVLMVFGQTELILAATDSYRLAEKKVNFSEVMNNENDLRVIVPAKTIQEILRIISGIKTTEQNLELYITENQILFVNEGVELVSRIIEGQYPDYKQIIPTIHKTKAVVDISSLSRAVKAASLFSKTGVNDVNLDFPAGKNVVVVSSVSGMTGENITELEARVDGDDNSVVVNYRYLIDGLNNISSELISIEVVDGNTPCILRSGDDESYLYIIMPIKQ